MDYVTTSFAEKYPQARDLQVINASTGCIGNLPWWRLPAPARLPGGGTHGSLPCELCAGDKFGCHGLIQRKLAPIT
jgi:hypothetical protein